MNTIQIHILSSVGSLYYLVTHVVIRFDLNDFSLPTKPERAVLLHGFQETLRKFKIYHGDLLLYHDG